MTDLLADDSEILFRQIHPSFVQDGQPSSQPFMPTSKDEDKLSLDRSSLTTAAASQSRFIAEGNKSVAVYGLNVGEFREEGLPCKSDPVEQAPGKLANPAHAYADYSQHGNHKQKIIAKRLKIKAIARGPLHP